MLVLMTNTIMSNTALLAEKVDELDSIGGQDIRPHTYDYMLHKVPNMSELQFQRAFRLPHKIMSWHVDSFANNAAVLANVTLRPFANNAERLAWPIAMAVYRLAHGQDMFQIADRFDVGEAMIDAATWVILPRCFVSNGSTVFPNTDAKRRAEATFYYNRVGCGIPDVVGLIDGTIFQCA